jgi:hypothetical protein
MEYYLCLVSVPQKNGSFKPCMKRAVMSDTGMISVMCRKHYNMFRGKSAETIRMVVSDKKQKSKYFSSKIKG